MEEIHGFPRKDVVQGNFKFLDIKITFKN